MTHAVPRMQLRVALCLLACAALPAGGILADPGEPPATESSAEPTAPAEAPADSPGEPATQPAEAGEVSPATPPGAGWLREVVVTATRGEIESFAAPYTVDTVPFDDFRSNRLYRTPTRAIEDVPSVMVQKTSNAMGSPYIRGFTSFRTLLLIDGVRLNNSVFRPGPNQYWNLVDPYTVDRMEVVKGPSSVLYGSDAIGGTVNAVMRGPEMLGEGLKSWRQIYSRVSTAEQSYIGRAEINASYGAWAALVGGTYRNFSDVDGGAAVGPQENTGYGDCAADAKIVYRPDPDTTWTFAHYEYYQNDAWRTHKTIYGVAWEGTTVGNERIRRLDQYHNLSYVRFAKRNLGAAVDEVELTFSHQLMTEERLRVRSDGRRDIQGFDVNTYGLTAVFVTPSPIGKWTYGVEWYHDRVGSFRDNYAADGSFSGSSIQGPIGDDACYDLFGVFIQDEIPLGDRVDVTLGGRYTYARADADRVSDPDTGGVMSVSDDWDTLVGSARVSWFVDAQEHWNVFGGVSQGFRAPNLSDLTRLDTARTDEIETPSPGLDPEHYLSFEAGVKTRYDNFSAQAAWHHTCIDDMIVRTPTGNVVQGDNEVTKQNVGDGFVQGIELEAQWRFLPQWTAFGNFAWMDGEVDTFPTSAPITVSEPRDRLMPPTWRAGLRWDSADGKLWAQAGATFALKADKLSTRDRADTQRIPPGGTPGYCVLDLNGGWRVNEDLDLWVGLENVTNEDYRIHGSGVNEPGFNFKFGLRWRF